MGRRRLLIQKAGKNPVPCGWSHRIRQAQCSVRKCVRVISTAHHTDSKHMYVAEMAKYGVRAGVLTFLSIVLISAAGVVKDLKAVALIAQGVLSVAVVLQVYMRRGQRTLKWGGWGIIIVCSAILAAWYIILRNPQYKIGRNVVAALVVQYCATRIVMGPIWSAAFRR
jgi:hypothetical protein